MYFSMKSVPLFSLPKPALSIFSEQNKYSPKIAVTSCSTEDIPL
jgi:hypothetical protein